MILEGNERGYGAQLAQHLLNPRDNDHVTVHALDGFVADDLAGAFAEAEAISQATQCQKYLFSLSLNPPPDKEVPVEVFEETVAQVERKLGLTGQPRAIVFHEKSGRRHAHCVWSRIDGERLRAVNLSLYKRKLKELSRELYLTHDWEMPQGFTDAAKRDPHTYSRQEAAQAQRLKRDPKVLKAMFRHCWEASDSRTSFEAALKQDGYLLARGERRGFVAVDAHGKIWSLSRWCGIKPKEMRARLGLEANLPSVAKVTAQARGAPAQPSDPRKAAFEARRAKLVDRQRKDRARLLDSQEARRIAEITARRNRLPTGLRGAMARVTGQYQTLLRRFEAETAASTARDRQEQQILINRQLADRRTLKLEGQTHGLSGAFSAALRVDPRQRLVVKDDDLTVTKDQLLRDPSLILGHISHKEAEFGRTDILRALAKRIDDPFALQAATQTALKSPEIVLCPTDGGPARYTTRDYQSAEARLDRATQAMAASGAFAVDRTHIRQAVKLQNAEMQRAFGGRLSAEQRGALDHVLGNHQMSCVVGLAGAGKSTLLATAREAWERQGTVVHGAALAGKAADGLETASGIASRTLASLETSWENGYAPIERGDVLVVDEAGMIGTRQMARVTAKVEEIGAKLVLVGDPDQLQPIEAGTPFRRVVDRHGAARLTEIHRQKDAWQKQASRDLAAGNIDAAVERYSARDAVTHNDDREGAIEALMESYAMDVASRGQSASRLAFAHRRKDVHALNQSIRAALRSGDDQPPETLVTTETGNRAFAQGDRMAFSRNDKGVGVKNGMLGTVLSVSPHEMAVALDGDKPRTVRFNPQRFQSFDHGYAVTIHKSQGATVDKAFVLASRSLDRHLAYVAMTRHRTEMRLFFNAQDRPNWTPRRNGPSLARDHRTRSGPSMG